MVIDQEALLRAIFSRTAPRMNFDLSVSPSSTNRSNSAARLRGILTATKTVSVRLVGFFGFVVTRLV